MTTNHNGPVFGLAQKIFRSLALARWENLMIYLAITNLKDSQHSAGPLHPPTPRGPKMSVALLTSFHSGAITFAHRRLRNRRLKKPPNHPANSNHREVHSGLYYGEMSMCACTKTCN